MKATENEELKQLMNARLWQCLVDDSETVKAMVEKFGFSKQMFYNMKDNQTFPATDTIAKIKLLVPILDMEALYSLDPKATYKGEGVYRQSDMDRVQEEVNTWKGRFMDMEHKFNDLQNRFNNLTETMANLAAKMNLSFPESSSQTTAEVMIAQIGFVLGEGKQTTPTFTKVDDSDSGRCVPMYRDRQPARRLNSLDRPSPMVA